MLRVIEIISETIQGEGEFSGVPCQFIRLAGCNGHCVWCDTKESWRLDSGNPMTESEILNQLSGIGIVCITGGDPLLQDCGELIRLLKLKNYKVHFELHSIGEIRVREREPRAACIELDQLERPEDIKIETTEVPSWLMKADHITFCPKFQLKYNLSYLRKLSDSGEWTFSLKLVAFPSEECFKEIDAWVFLAMRYACFRKLVFIQCGCNTSNEIVDGKAIAEKFIGRNYPPSVRLSCQIHKIIGFK